MANAGFRRTLYDLLSERPEQPRVPWRTSCRTGRVLVPASAGQDGGRTERASSARSRVTGNGSGSHSGSLAADEAART